MSATTPTRRSHGVNTPSKGSPRRVLGDLTPRALNVHAGHADPSESTRARSPLKQMQTLSPQLLRGKENQMDPGALNQSRKRSIYEVDDAENLDANARLGERVSLAQAAALSATAMRIHEENTVVDLLEPGTPTERNTPTPTPEPEVGFDVVNSQESQASRESFSSFINYGACSSQNAEQSQQNQHRQRRAPPPPSSPPAKRETRSRAELLRTRLCFGIYKINTNQITKRSSDVISHWEASSFGASRIDASISMATTATTDSVLPPHPAHSPIRRDFQPIFVKANLDPGRPIGKLTPAPVLLPTVTTSRNTHEYQMPASPPRGSISPSKLMSPTKQSVGDGEGRESTSREGRAEDGLRKLQRFQDSDSKSVVELAAAASANIVE